ncbi:hypothetical protein [Paenibacillus sp. USHLN196]|uniref:hypothetical protein n=1 Tax=Paenibacillus sp. USHLN196 TaxID=3081291 RepID=UPI00301684B5
MATPRRHTRCSLLVVSAALITRSIIIQAVETLLELLVLGASNGGGGVTPPLTNNNSSSGVQVLVNGWAESAGSLTTTTVNGKQVVTISVNAEAIAQKLNTEPAGSVITIPVTG